jgi:hypothetical protein
MLASQASNCALHPKQIAQHCKSQGLREGRPVHQRLLRTTLTESVVFHSLWCTDLPPLMFHLLQCSALFREERTVGGSRYQYVLTEVSSTIIPLFIHSFHHLKESEEHIMKLFIIFIMSYRYSYYLLFLKHLQSLHFLQNKRPNFTPITVLPFYFPNKFKRLEWWYCHTHNWILMSGDPLQQIRSLESRLKDKLCSSRSKIFPPIKRGASLDVYLTTSGNGVIAHPKLASNLGLLALIYVFHQK